MTVESATETGSCCDRHPDITDTPAVSRMGSSHTTATISVEEQMWDLEEPCAAPPAAVAFGDGLAWSGSMAPAEEACPELSSRLSVPSLKSAAESLASCSGHVEQHSGAAAATAAEEDAEDGCIPFDYESEMEECSRYTFSDGPYSPSMSAALAAVASPRIGSMPSSCRRPDTPRIPSVLSLSDDAAQSLEQVPLSPQWCERQRRDNASHHAGEHSAWQQGMRQAAAAEPSQMRYALRSLVREARCREIRALRSTPAVAFAKMDVPHSGGRTRISLRASCMLASATSPAQRKACYIQIIRQHWKALEERLEELLTETEKEDAAASESHLRSVGYALNALSLFSSDPKLIIREMNMGYVEEQRRQRHDREAQLLMTLESQGRLFLLPTLYAEEVEEPVPVLHIESVLTPNEKFGEYTLPWQRLSPEASLNSPSLSPMSDDSVGALSPCSSGCISATCSPMLASQSPSVVPTRLKVGYGDAWKGLQPRLPFLDLFMTAPAVLPSTVVADGDVGVPYGVPADPTYVQCEVDRQGAFSRAAAANSLSSSQPSGAMVRGGSTSAATSVGHLQPLPQDVSEESCGSCVGEDVYDYNEVSKLGSTEVLLSSFGMSDAVTATSPVAPALATWTDG
ncbi:hypothetical protein LSCM1_01984 [Leishmania martiniquensis]|uniref:Uncharacterized protein n=1 Tax=Leishmania martiniquensis TaxID=1580590 RepID=A0A836KHB7_9TRYP|nr:hypothetical protein LSCM1_01984 [Leishmania martiniquensis]